MKNFLALISFSVAVVSSFAQPIPRQSIEDDVIGWMKVYHFKGTKEPKKVDDSKSNPIPAKGTNFNDSEFINV